MCRMLSNLNEHLYLSKGFPSEMEMGALLNSSSMYCIVIAGAEYPHQRIQEAFSVWKWNTMRMCCFNHSNSVVRHPSLKMIEVSSEYFFRKNMDKTEFIRWSRQLILLLPLTSVTLGLNSKPVFTSDYIASREMVYIERTNYFLKFITSNSSCFSFYFRQKQGYFLDNRTNM